MGELTSHISTTINVGETDSEVTDALCISGSLQESFLCERPEEIPLNEMQEQFLNIAEKYMKDMELVSRKEKQYLMEIKEALPIQAKRGIEAVKTSMKVMHARYAKELDQKLNEITSILTRIEHFQEEAEDLKQLGNTNEMEIFLKNTSEQKEMIESMVQKHVSALNRKRVEDERMFSKFSESIQQQVQYSIRTLENCILKSEAKRKTYMDSKYREIKAVFQDIQKME